MATALTITTQVAAVLIVVAGTQAIIRSRPRRPGADRDGPQLAAGIVMIVCAVAMIVGQLLTLAGV